LCREVIAVDTSALVAIIHGEAEAQAFALRIAAEDRCLVSAVSVLEASIVLANLGGGTSWLELDALIAGFDLRICAHDAALTDIARQAFLRFGKGRHPAKLNFGDCAAYALAKSEGLALLFKGNDFSQTDIAAAG
jgi:ribonuclease VapC